jgi:hypothetical protein
MKGMLIRRGRFFQLHFKHAFLPKTSVVIRRAQIPTILVICYAVYFLHFMNSQVLVRAVILYP